MTRSATRRSRNCGDCRAISSVRRSCCTDRPWRASSPRKANTNTSLLDAIRFHTVGSPNWDRTGRALYMADFLEPGRGFAKRDRAFLAYQVPHDFDGVFRQVLRARLEHALREGFTLFPETVGLWNEVR